jgi:hypothetical protein
MRPYGAEVNFALPLPKGRAIAQAVSRRLPTVAARVRSQVRLRSICMDKVALGQVSSKYFGFPCQFSFLQMLDTHLSSGVGTVGQLVADVPSGLSLTPSHENLGGGTTKSIL